MFETIALEPRKNFSFPADFLKEEVRDEAEAVEQIVAALKQVEASH